MNFVPYRFPVSVKGVVVRSGQVLLLHNERDEWELPGGKLDLGEDPRACVAREIAEEVGWEVAVDRALDAWQYHIREGVDVLIVTYGCHLKTDTEPVISNEHNAIGLFTEADLTKLRMPAGYKQSVSTWFADIRERVGQ